ncbi:MAG: ATP-dependent zinc metalloprotease FtsH [Clostridia bacterium]
MKNKKINGFGAYIIILLIVLGTFLALQMSSTPNVAVYSDVVNYFNNEQVESFDIEGSDLTLQLKDGEVVTHELANINIFMNDLSETITAQTSAGILTEYDYKTGADMYIIASLAPYLILFLGLGVVWYIMMKRQDGGGKSAMNFGKSKAKIAAEGDLQIRFSDVAGSEEEKAELVEIVDFLRNPQKYIDLGARIPKGVLLVGPPGTGKTLLAKAVAGEAGVPFLSISGSDFVELYVGVGASRVRDLFAQAKKSQPAIIFIDEIDAVGRQRGAGVGGGHDEREQTLNQLLVEMDGFGINAGVIVIAATNRADILDPAILRPGRFDRQVYVGIPDISDREAILKVHAKNKKLKPDLDLADIAKSTPGFTGADLENLLNEAALLTARRGKEEIDIEEIQDSFLKVIMGTEKKSRVMNLHEKKLTAYHEAGHAVITKLMPHQDPVHQVSIIPRGRAGGFTLSLPQEDLFYTSKIRMEEELVVLLGGRVAEQLVIGDISTGASNDIERATKIARDMVTRYGMSKKVGTINYASDPNEVFLGRDFGSNQHMSSETAFVIDKEVQDIIARAYENCEQLLSTHMNKLENVAEFLIRNEVIDGDVFEKLFNGEILEDLPKKNYPKVVLSVPPMDDEKVATVVSNDTFKRDDSAIATNEDETSQDEQDND